MILRTSDRGRMGIALLAALALHGGAFAAMLWRPDGPTRAPGENEISVDLAPAAVAVESVEAQAAAPSAPAAEEAQTIEPVEPADATVLPEQIAALDAALVEPTQVDPVEPAPAPMTAEAVAPPATSEVVAVEPIENASPDAVVVPPTTTGALAPPETVTARTIPQAVEAPVPPRPQRPRTEAPAKLVETKRPERRVARAAPPAPASRASAATPSREGGGAAASADPNLIRRYAAQIAAALKGRLRYPDDARAQRIQGVATLRFTLDRSGRIVGSSLVKSAGDPRLDQAALATVAAGNSLPPPPDAIADSRVTISVPLRFVLNGW